MKSKTKEGFVYVMSNPSMPGLVKIGIARESVEKRKKSLSSPSGVPTPFVIEYACKVTDCKAVEDALLTAFTRDRINMSREFFRIDPIQAIVLLELMKIEDVTEQATADQPEAKRNPRFDFDKMGIPVGAELVFVRNNNIKATVGENNKVKYNDKILSLSALTQKLTGYIVRPVQYWTYDDRNLLNIYNATYPSKG